MKSIKELRISAGLTQEKLANLTGLTTVTINRIEKTGNMRLATYNKIIELLKSYQND